MFSRITTGQPELLLLPPSLLPIDCKTTKDCSRWNLDAAFFGKNQLGSVPKTRSYPLCLEKFPRSRSCKSIMLKEVAMRKKLSIDGTRRRQSERHRSVIRNSNCCWWIVGEWAVDLARRARSCQ